MSTTTKRMLEVSAEVFAARGYRQADVQLIADELGVGKGTLYRHFRSKEGLFLSSVDHGMKELMEKVHAAADESPDLLEKVRAGVRAYLGFFDEHPELVELLIHERAEFPEREQTTYFAYRDANRERWETLWSQLIEEGRVRDVPVRRILDVINDLLYGAIFTNTMGGRSAPFEEQAEDVLDVLFHGFVTEGRS